MDLGHWIYDKEFEIDDWFGFIYRIIDTTTGQAYIGKKQFWSITRKKIKDRKNRKKIIKESKWREYTSSSNHVNKAIEESGKDSFIFIIESLHETRASLYYEEVRVQITEDVLRKKLDNGIPMYYNKQVGAVKFLPPIPTDLEEEMKLNHTIGDEYINSKLDNKQVKILIENHRYHII